MISVHQATGLRSGATREGRTPSRCIQGSYAPERWRRGDQPWDRTTFSRASAERYDHTSSLVGAADGSRTRPSRLRGERASGNTSAAESLVQARGLEPRFSGNRPDVLPLDEAWVVVPAVGVEPTWPRLKGGHAAAASRWR